MKSHRIQPCDKFSPMLRRQLDGELAAEELLVLQRHLGDCATCRKESRQLRAVTEGMQRLSAPRSAVSDFAFAHRIIARARNPWYAKLSPMRLIPQWPVRTWAGATAAVAMTLGSGVAALYNPAVRRFAGLDRREEVLMARPASMRAPVFVNGSTFEPVRVDMLGDRLRTLNRTLKIRPVLSTSDPFRTSLLHQQSLNDLNSILTTYNIEPDSVEVLPVMSAQGPSSSAQPVVFSIENMTENGDLR